MRGFVWYRSILMAGLFFFLTGLLAGCGGKKEQKEPEVADILKAVQDAYGEDYLPDTDLDEAALSDFFGLDMSLVDSFAAQMPMISAQPDRVIIAKAAEGKADELEAALEGLRTALVEDKMIYPINIAKTQASVVVRNGDYVAFFLLGASDDRTDATEEEQLEFAKEQTQKAVDAFTGCF